MKQLLRKEYKLTASPLTFFFLLFAFMAVIPGYPILVGAFFTCLGIFYTFQFAREYNDVLYTALLPVEKSDVVKARFAFVISIQITGFVVSAVLTLLRMGLLRTAEPYVKNPLMNANLVFLGYYLFVMALFNLIFVTGFFKTAYIFGKPFILFCIVGFLFIGITEILHHIPGIEFLNTCGWDHLGIQAGILLLGLIIYVGGTILAQKKCIKEFEQIDL